MLGLTMMMMMMMNDGGGNGGVDDCYELLNTAYLNE